MLVCEGIGRRCLRAHSHFSMPLYNGVSRGTRASYGVKLLLLCHLPGSLPAGDREPRQAIGNHGDREPRQA
jgi:hypothetical protein